MLGEFVGDLCIGCPTEIVEWGAESEILDAWSTIKDLGPVSSNGDLIMLGLTRFCSKFSLPDTGSLNFVDSRFPGEVEGCKMYGQRFKQQHSSRGNRAYAWSMTRT